MDITVILKRLGHPKHAGKIYAVLTMSLEPLSVSVIANRAEVSRVVVYRCLAALLQDKLVKQIVTGKRQAYVVESPHALTEALEYAWQSAAEVVTAYATFREKDVPSHTRFLYGTEGIREAFDDVIAYTPRGGTVYRYTSEKNLDQVNAYLAPDYRNRRDAKKLERLVISNPVSSAQKRKRLERFIRCIPTDAATFDQNIIQFIYGNRVSFIDVSNEQVTIIEHKELASFQKVIFMQLYQKLPRD